MAPKYAVDVERRGVEPLGDGRDFWRHHEQKHRIGVDEAAYQPWTSNTIDLRPATRHPDGATFVVTRWQLVGANQDFVDFPPGFKASFERLCIDTFVS